MSIIDKFLDVMRLNDDEDYDYDEEEDYEVKEKKTFPQRTQKRRGTAADRSNF